MATAQGILDQIDAQISALLADSSNYTTYRIGDKTVNKTEALKMLGDLQKVYLARLESEPYEEIQGVAFSLDQFGVETTENVGDDLR